MDRHRLAYVSELPVNWCSGLGTVLANEEVTADGRSERGNFPVFRKPLAQWMLRITAYADRLLADLDHIDWPDRVRTMPKNWIGHSVGAHVNLPSSAGDITPVFTTRPDTLFGAAFYLVLAPEHPMVDALTDGPPEDGVNPELDRRLRHPAEAAKAYRAQPRRRPTWIRVPRRRPNPVFSPAILDQSVDRRRAAHLHRRLRPDGLRHRRDHGRARAGRAGLGLRRGVQPADHPHRPTHRRL